MAVFTQKDELFVLDNYSTGLGKYQTHQTDFLFPGLASIFGHRLSFILPGSNSTFPCTCRFFRHLSNFLFRRSKISLCEDSLKFELPGPPENLLHSQDLLQTIKLVLKSSSFTKHLFRLFTFPFSWSQY